MCPEGARFHEATTETPEEHHHEVWCTKSGLKHGPYLRQHPDGTPAAEGRFRIGKEEGRWTTTHANGQPASTGMYSEGQRIGEWTWWHAGGEKAEEGLYRVGAREGRWTTWYPSGRMRTEGMYLGDRQTGDWAHYNDDDDNSLSHFESWQNGEPFRETPLASDLLKQAAWLHGCWHNEDQSSSECWRTAGLHFNGARRGDDMGTELLGMEVVDGDVLYHMKPVARPSQLIHRRLWEADRDSLVTLKLTYSDDDTLIFTRNAAAFPNRIEYVRDSDGLTVVSKGGSKAETKRWRLSYMSLRDTLRQRLNRSFRDVRQQLGR